MLQKNTAKKFCVKPRIIPYNLEDFLDALRLKNILKTILLQFIFFRETPPVLNKALIRRALKPVF